MPILRKKPPHHIILFSKPILVGNTQCYCFHTMDNSYGVMKDIAHDSIIPVPYPNELFSLPQMRAAFELVRLSGRRNTYMDWAYVMVDIMNVLTVLHQHDLANGIVNMLHDRSALTQALQSLLSYRNEDLNQERDAYLMTIPILRSLVASQLRPTSKEAEVIAAWKAQGDVYNPLKGFLAAVDLYVEDMHRVARDRLGNDIIALNISDTVSKSMHVTQLATVLESYPEAPKNPLDI